MNFWRDEIAETPLESRGRKENKIRGAGLRQDIEDISCDVFDATLINEDKRWADSNLAFHFLKRICEIQRFKSRLPGQ